MQNAVVMIAARLDREDIPEEDWEEMIHEWLSGTPYASSLSTIRRELRAYRRVRDYLLEERPAAVLDSLQ